MRIRFLRTEGFRLSALYAAVFALSVVILGGFVLVIISQALRDQIVTFARADVGAIRNGYVIEGEHEAREVVQQLMAGPANSGFYLLQREGKVLEGNLPAMGARTGTIELSVSSGGRSREVLGVGDFLAPGLYVFSGSDLAQPRAVEARILNIMLVLFPAAILIAVAGGALLSWSFLRRTDAMARACRDIMHGDLKLRIPVRGTRDELDRLAEAINEMLTRISALMENLAQVSNDIAHDCAPRSPICATAWSGRATIARRKKTMRARWTRRSPRPTRYWDCSPPCCVSPRSRAAIGAPLSPRSRSTASWRRCANCSSRWRKRQVMSCN